jgi:hypothetical protein
MLKRLLGIINPVTFFLLFNLISPREITLFEEYENLDNIEYVSVGSSHGGNSFDFENYPNSINLGLGSQRMHYGLKLLEAIDEKLDSQSTIIIPLSIFSFCGQYDGPPQRYLGFFTRQELNISFEEELLDRYFPYLGINNTRLLFNGLTYSSEFIDDGKNKAKAHLEMANECEIIDQTILLRVKSYIISNTDKRIILVITPYYNSYWRSVLEEEIVINKVYNTIFDIIDEFNLEFYDYSMDPEFYDSSEYFNDSDHLNVRGAKIFTDKFINEINQK